MVDFDPKQSARPEVTPAIVRSIEHPSLAEVGINFKPDHTYNVPGVFLRNSTPLIGGALATNSELPVTPIIGGAPVATQPSVTPTAPAALPAVEPTVSTHFSDKVTIRSNANNGQTIIVKENGVDNFLFRDAKGKEIKVPTSENFSKDYESGKISQKAYERITEYQSARGIGEFRRESPAPVEPTPTPRPAPVAPASPATGATVVNGPSGTHVVAGTNPGQNQTITVRQGREYTEPQLTAQEIRNKVLNARADAEVAKTRYEINALSFQVDRDTGLPLQIKENGVIPAAAGGGSSPFAKVGFYVGYDPEGNMFFCPPSAATIKKANKDAADIVRSEKERDKNDNTFGGIGTQVGKEQGKKAAESWSNVLIREVGKKIEEKIE